MKSHVTLRSLLLSSLLCLVVARSALAGSAAWNVSPASNDWQNAANWTPNTVPNGVADDAAFASSDVTSVTVSAATTLDSIIFNAGASAFTITTTSPSLTLSGAGVVNNSGVTQNFVSGPPEVNRLAPIVFTNNATAGVATMFTLQPGSGTGGSVSFLDNSSGGAATFVAAGGRSEAGGTVTFFDNATAADGSYIANGPLSGNGSNAKGGLIVFNDFSSAGNASITANGGDAASGYRAYVSFIGSSSAANATLTAHGSLTTNLAGQGVIGFAGSADAANCLITADGDNPGLPGGFLTFSDDSTGGTCRINLRGEGSLDISLHYTNPALFWLLMEAGRAPAPGR